jgi:circadian clock protein KaiC
MATINGGRMGTEGKPAKSSKEVKGSDKVSSGVVGFDYLLRGGFPAHRILLIEGHPGAGKTTFGLQFLLDGVKRGEACMYITLSETADELRANAASHGWRLDGIDIQEMQPAENLLPEEQYTLFHPAEIELGDLVRHVFEAVDTLKPARLVLDSVSDMRLLARDSLRYRRQILALKQFFVGRGCTLLLLNENGGTDLDPHIQSLSHGVIRLEQAGARLWRNPTAARNLEVAWRGLCSGIPRLQDSNRRYPRISPPREPPTTTAAPLEDPEERLEGDRRPPR